MVLIPGPPFGSSKKTVPPRIILDRKQTLKLCSKERSDLLPKCFVLRCCCLVESLLHCGGDFKISSRTNVIRKIRSEYTWSYFAYNYKMQSIFANSCSVSEVTLKALQSNGKGAFPQLKSAVAAVLVLQTRGGKKKFGEITRDPFKTFQQKLERKQRKRHAKYKLLSDERKQMKLAFPFNVQSIGGCYQVLLTLMPFTKTSLRTRSLVKSERGS